MKRLVFRLLLALILSVVGATTATNAAPYKPTPPAQIGAGPPPEMMGMVIRDPWYEGTYPGQPNLPNRVAQEQMGATLAQLGVRWVRLEFHIDATTATTATHVARNDYFINEVAPRYGLQVLGLLSFGLVRERGPRDLLLTDTLRVDPVYGGGVNDYMATWLDRARFIANRYQGRLLAYELLNEQNRLPPTGDAISASVAARLHTKFYRFFKQTDAQAPGQEWRQAVALILGGLHPAGTGTPGRHGYVSDRDYLTQYYESDGFKSFLAANGRYPLDGIGYHPYPEEIRNSLRSDTDMINTRMGQVRSLVNTLYQQQGVANPPLFWVTEIGYNAGWKGQSSLEQAAFMHDLYTAMALRGDVATVFWFKYEDFPPLGGPDAQHWGVVRIPFTNGLCEGGACYEPTGAIILRRPAFYAYQELAGVPVRVDLFIPLVAKLEG